MVLITCQDAPQIAHWLTAIGASGIHSLRNNLHFSGLLYHTTAYVKDLRKALPAELAREMCVLWRHGHAALASQVKFQLNEYHLRMVFQVVPLTTAEVEGGYAWMKVQDVMDQAWLEHPDCECLPITRYALGRPVNSF